MNTKAKKFLKKGRIKISFPNRALKKGRPPGSLEVHKEEGAKSVLASQNLYCMKITPQGHEEHPHMSWTDFKSRYRSYQKPAHDQGIGQQQYLFWINVDGPRDEDFMKDLGHFFNIGPLTLEDIATTDQRPKLEDHEHFLLLILRNFRNSNSNSNSGSGSNGSSGNGGEVISEQASFVLGKNFLISFQEGGSGDIFETIKGRIRKSPHPFAKWKADYLFYSLIDSIIDNYFVIVDNLFEEVDDIEKELIYNKNPVIIEKIYEKKIEIIFMRRFVSPLREAITQLYKLDTDLIQEDNVRYLRDLHDHLMQVSESIESFRDTVSLLADFTLSISSNTINEVMKFLTIFTAIFIPLTFITSIYGMNFVHFPELQWRHGVALVWVLMGLIVASLLYYFRRKRWL